MVFVEIHANDSMLTSQKKNVQLGIVAKISSNKDRLSCVFNLFNDWLYLLSKIIYTQVKEELLV